MKQIIVVVSMLLLFIAVGIFGIKNSINPKQKIKNLNLSTDLILPTGTTDVIRIISNIEKGTKYEHFNILTLVLVLIMLL